MRKHKLQAENNLETDNTVLIVMLCYWIEFIMNDELIEILLYGRFISTCVEAFGFVFAKWHINFTCNITKLVECTPKKDS